MKYFWYGLLFLGLSACSPQTVNSPVRQPEEVLIIQATQDGDTSESFSNVQSRRAELDDFGPAPELENEVWLNTEEPLRLEALRGKVVLLDMWTFG